jgi:hypothetical protein
LIGLFAGSLPLLVLGLLKNAASEPRLKLFPFTCVHGNSFRLLFGRVFRAAK